MKVMDSKENSDDYIMVVIPTTHVDPSFLAHRCAAQKNAPFFRATLRTLGISSSRLTNRWLEHPPTFDGCVTRERWALFDGDLLDMLVY